MGIFVTDGAKRAVVAILCQLVQGAVAVNQIVLIARRNGNRLTIYSLLAVLQVFTHPPLVRPYQIRARTVVHAITGIYDEQLVDVAIVIPVVETPVNVTLQEFLHNILDEIL